MAQVLALPARRALRQLGADLALARRRRRISTESMAERALVARATLAKIEKGDPTVSMGAWVSVLTILGFEDRLGRLAAPESDQVGVSLDAERTPQRIRG